MARDAVVSGGRLVDEDGNLLDVATNTDLTNLADAVAALPFVFAPVSVVAKLDHLTGIYGGKVGMHRWRTSGRDLKHLVCFGDSVSQGVGVSDGVTTKTDGYPDHLRAILRDDLNAEIHEGFQPIYWMSDSGGEVRWTSSGGWTNVGGLAENLGPHGQNQSAVRSNNNTLRTLTWTRPSHVSMDRAIVYWVDDANVTAGAFWSYSTDGGSTWTEVATASPASPTLMATEVAGLSDPADFRIRNADEAGTTWAVSPTFLGIDVRNGDTGWVVHNIGQSGASLSLPLASGTSGAAAATRLGDWRPLFDLLEPELVILNFSNDCVGYDQATFETAIDAVVSHLDSLGTDVVHYGFPDQVRTNGTHTANLPIVRQHITDKVLEYNGLAAHFHERWTNVATSKALGYMANVLFPIHPTRAGDREVASTLARLLRTFG